MHRCDITYDIKLRHVILHGEARFCAKSWYTSAYRTNTNSHFVVQLRLNTANRLKKSWISHFYVTYEILPIKKHLSLWYNVWRISWDMSFVLGEARFCAKSWYTSGYWTNEPPFCCTVVAKYNKSTPSLSVSHDGPGGPQNNRKNCPRSLYFEENREPLF